MSTKIAESMRERILTLENDISLGGWDQSHSFYVIEEVDEDPYLIKAAEFDIHPCDFLDSAPQLNPKIAKGVVLVNECWMTEVPQEVSDILREKMNELGIPDSERPQVADLAMRAFYSLIPPSMNPNRIECRWVQCLLNDGTPIAMYRKRGDNPQFVDEGILDGRVLDSMKRLFGIESERAN